MHLRLILVFVLVTEMLTDSNLVTERTAEDALRKWIKMEDNMISSMNSMVKTIITPILQNTTVELSPQCFNHIVEVVVDMQDLKLWALKMIDSTGKPHGAEMQGRFGTFGNYFECLDVVFPGHEPDKSVGQYCLLDIHFPLPPLNRKLNLQMDLFEGQNVTFKYEVVQHIREKATISYELPLRFGVCIPSSCTKDDFIKVARAAVGDLGLTPDVYSCEVKKPVEFDALQIVILVVFATFTVLVIISALVGICTKQDFNHLFPIEDFNPVRNLRSTMKTKLSNGNILECLNGIRTISLFWVILSHAYAIIDPIILRNLSFVDEFRKDWASAVITNSLNSIDSFLVITSILTAYSLVNQVDKTGIRVFNVPMIILRRVLRFLPSIFLVIGLAILIPTSMSSSGPLWHEIMGHFENNCRQKWWKNLLFINNYETADKSCLPQTYYVSLDLQCLLIILVYFWLLFKKPTYAYSYLVFLTIVSVIITGFITYILDFGPIPIVILEGHASYVDHNLLLGYGPHSRIGGYAIGAALGTILARRKNIAMSKIQLTAGWSISIATALAIVYGPVQWISGVPYNAFDSVMFSAFKGISWSMCVCWVVLVCATGHGGVVNEMLSWRGFQPISRLTYLMYLSHIIFMFGFAALLLGSMDFSHRIIVSFYFGGLVCTFMGSLVLRLIFEAPVINLERRLFNSLFQKRAATQTTPKNAKNQCETFT